METYFENKEEAATRTNSIPPRDHEGRLENYSYDGLARFLLTLGKEEVDGLNWSAVAKEYAVRSKRTIVHVMLFQHVKLSNSHNVSGCILYYYYFDKKNDDLK